MHCYLPYHKQSTILRIVHTKMPTTEPTTYCFLHRWKQNNLQAAINREELSPAKTI